MDQPCPLPEEENVLVVGNLVLASVEMTLMVLLGGEPPPPPPPKHHLLAMELPMVEVLVSP